jgi:hypothetical protein
MGDKIAKGSNVLSPGFGESDENRRTLVDGSIGLWSRPSMSAPIAFLRYLHELTTARAAYSDQHVFLTLVDSGGEANRSMVLGPGESAVVGRHKKCDIKLEHENVALRHLAVHVAKPSQSVAGRALLRIWDLHTGKTLTCEDGTEVEALEADGPVFLSLGRYHLAMIPLGQLPKTMPLTTKEAWACLPKREFISSLAQGTGTALLPERRFDMNTSSVTRMPSSIGLQALESSQAGQVDTVATLVVQGTEKRREFNIGAHHLERGILIGRYRRCVGSGLDATVSRVHLMIATIGGETVAIDTASTVGSRLAMERFQTTPLLGPKKIWLSKHSYLVWRPAQ